MEPDEGRAARAERVLQLVEEFITDQRISCSECVWQSDRVIDDAYSFIDGLCAEVGFYGHEDNE